MQYSHSLQSQIDGNLLPGLRNQRWDINVWRVTESEDMEAARSRGVECNSAKEAMIVSPDFNAAEHSYSISGRPLLGVSEVLQANGLIDSVNFNDFSRDRGSAVHSAIALDIAGRLDPASVDPVHVAPYLAQARMALRMLKVSPVHVETPMCDALHGFAGTPDICGTIDGWDAVIDWKTGQAAPWHRYQTAGYALLWRPATASMVHRLTVTLAPEAFRVWPHESVADIDGFLALLRAAQIRKEMGR